MRPLSSLYLEYAIFQSPPLLALIVFLEKEMSHGLNIGLQAEYIIMHVHLSCLYLRKFHTENHTL